jgi:hypothetical protein
MACDCSNCESSSTHEKISSCFCSSDIILNRISDGENFLFSLLLSVVSGFVSISDLLSGGRPM